MGRGDRPTAVTTRQLRAKHERKGYSIVELLIVVLILGIISVNVAPQFVATIGKQSVKSAAFRVKTDIEYARLRAKTTASPQSVVFAPDLNAYFLPGVPPMPQQSIYRVDLDGRRAANIVSAQFSNVSDTDLEFNAFGTPDSAGNIVLRAGSHQQTVFVTEAGIVELGPITWVSP